MRRLILEEPCSRAAVWSRNLAVFALLVAIFGVLLARQGLDPGTALAIEGSALALSSLAVFFAFVALIVVWRTGYRGLGLALGGLVLSGLLFAYPTYVAVQAHGVPAVADVTTNPDDPPPFAQTLAAREARRGAILPAAPSPEQKALQAKLYPDLQTLNLDADPMDVYALVRKLLKRRRWTVIEANEPINFATGHIDVVLKTALMGFPADLTIRIRGISNKTQVDLRSLTRLGWQEQPGSNAARLQELATEIEDQTPES